MNLSRIFRGPVAYLVLILLLVFLFFNYVSGSKPVKTFTSGEVVQKVAAGDAKEITMFPEDQRLEGKLKDGTDFKAFYPESDFTELIKQFKEAGFNNWDTKIQRQSVLVSILVQLLPFVLIFGLFFFLMQQMQGGGNRVMNFGKAKAKLVSKDQPKVTFADVAGVDEAVEELEEIKEFLENPARFQAMGAKVPKGVLLYGPPGTGKTLLARAVAGEAGVPFFSIAGSDFVEMFVGVGASRVRDLFEQAKANAPAIVFVDELDAVGRHRGAGLGGGHDEREQTLNQLLVEMDGFDVKAGVILIAATNRPDILDPALLRPGRFDRQIVVDRPDLAGRRAILKVHVKGKPMDKEVDLDVIARRTPGFTGADLANVINEGALLAARYNKKTIGNVELEESIDRVVAGPERKSRVISDREKRVIAYHEAGHAIVAHALPNADPVHKVSVIPRGRALGYTLTLPTEDKFLVSRSELIDELAELLGGRVAEEMVFSDPTTGASNDIERATKIARQMVCEYGMSEKLGALTLGLKQENPFLGRDFSHQQDYSDEIAFEIDKEIRRLVDEAHKEAWEVLTTYRKVMDLLVNRLIEKETIDKPELLEILKPVTKRPARGMLTNGSRGNGSRAARARRASGANAASAPKTSASRAPGKRPRAQ
ncbi:MAG: ATP-dependent zinc metalloprotease FtsH [Actinomycetota bacterium]